MTERSTGPAGPRTEDGPALIAERYALRAVLGEGGMGSVYLAHDRVLREDVALKTLRPDHHAASDAAERLREEVRLARRVTHPNVARTFDIGLHEGVPFLTMEFVDGEDLSAWLERKERVSLSRLLDVALPICRGLQAAHAVGVIHRDLKPANVILARDGRVLLTDFGIARALRSDGRLTGDRAMLGTPAYMAPEQVTGTPEPDRRTDIYALGVVLFELWSGRLPFEGTTAMALALARLHQNAPDLAALAPETPPGLAAIVHRCLQREPDQRFQDVVGIIEALEALPGDARSQRMGPPRPPAPVDPTTETFAEAVGERPQPPARHPITVAVMPLRHHGRDPDTLLAEGLTEDLIDLLSMNERLFVRPHGTLSEDGAASRDLAALGRAAGVQCVVDGSLRQTADRLRLRVALITCADGFQVWAGRFEGDETSLFTLSEQAAAGLARAVLATRVPEPETAPSTGIGPEAMDLYLRARQEMNASWFGDLGAALALLDQARVLAPQDGRILSAAALARARAAATDPEQAHRHLEQAEQLARDARDRAPNRPEPRLALARVHYERLQLHDALRHVEQAVHLAPSSDQAHEFLGRILRETGPLHRAEFHLRTALALHPESPTALHDLMMTLALQQRWDEVDAILASTPENERLREAREAERSRTDLWRPAPRWLPEALPPTPPAGTLPLNNYLRQELLLTGRLSMEHEAWLHTARERTTAGSRTRSLVLQIRAEAFLRAGQHDRALDEIEDAVAQGLHDLMWLDHCPLLEPLRHESRFRNARTAIQARVRPQTV
ncbi:MAG: protein kinase [Deltaproteobacteria bacterium]|nr:MAG: protein kinase [Deltaproteobacteria bacterium]